MKALYSLTRHVAGFDFFNWMVLARADGAEEIVFDVRAPKVDKWARETVRRRYESILQPGPALAGLPWSEGIRGSNRWQAHCSGIVQFLAAGRNFRPLTSPRPPASGVEYTVTLRRTERTPSRNSDEAVWRAFAAQIGAQVIEDYELAPIGLHERIALYAGARMNFFVTNGPGMLCMFTPYPAAIFDCAQSPITKWGVVPGARSFQWRFGDQHLIWERPTKRILGDWFEAWHAGRLQ